MCLGHLFHSIHEKVCIFFIKEIYENGEGREPHPQTPPAKLLSGPHPRAATIILVNPLADIFIFFKKFK